MENDMATAISEKDYPLPEYLYVIFGADKEVYYFDTEWSRTSQYLNFIRTRCSDKNFFVVREEDSEKIEALW
jgi:hypothetical protein